jgi:hypothetical protein
MEGAERQYTCVKLEAWLLRSCAKNAFVLVLMYLHNGNVKRKHSGGIVRGGVVLLKQRRNARAGVRSRHTKQQAHQGSCDTAHTTPNTATQRRGSSSSTRTR